MGQVQLHHEDEIAVITIESPGRLNAFTRAMRGRIAELLLETDRDPALIGAVMTGAGDAFCAGQDFNESRTWDENTPWVEEFEQMFRAILGFSKPLVAAVNGVAAGGGFQTALMCDARIAHDGVRMGQPEVKWGLASITGTWLLQKSVGVIKARELVLSGRLIDADELVRLGLVDAVVPADQVLGAALSTCRALAQHPADSFARTKTWMAESIADEMSTVFRDAVRFHQAGFASGVSQAGASGFLAERGTSNSQ